MSGSAYGPHVPAKAEVTHGVPDLGELGDDFRCKICFNVQRVPLLDEHPWHYVSDGLFRLEGKVAGSLTAVLSLCFLRNFFSFGMRYVPSFEYEDGDLAAERDFAVFASEILQNDVDVIFGECKSFRSMEEKQKKDTRDLGNRTGTFLAFSTLLTDFSEDDKQFFAELIEAGQKTILLTRKHLEMPYHDVSEYSHGYHSFGRNTELLCRLTIRDVLGVEFSDKHYLRP